MPDIIKPRITPVPLAEGLAWRGGGNYRFEEKMDGVFAHCAVINADGAIKDSILIGELMPGGDFFAFDIASMNGTDVRAFALRDRLGWLGSVLLEECTSARLEVKERGRTVVIPHSALRTPNFGHGGEFLEAVLARGGEGAVAKDLDAPFGIGQFKCKRVETFDLVVVAKHESKSSVRLAWLAEGEDGGWRMEDGAGWCPVRGSNFLRVNVGDVIEVAAFGRTASGKLREPRFVKLRPDKSPQKKGSHARLEPDTVL